jgi:hypothetical protein
MQPAALNDFSGGASGASIDLGWQLSTDHVMGGVSHGVLIREIVAGRPAMRMRGVVNLENKGGFVQMSRDLADNSGSFDASAWRGVQLDVIGNAEEYNMHLRTGDLTRPWQSYRHSFRAAEQWQTVDFLFEHFVPHRTESPFDVGRLRRIGIVAIGRAFTVDLCERSAIFFLSRLSAPKPTFNFHQVGDPIEHGLRFRDSNGETTSPPNGDYI